MLPSNTFYTYFAQSYSEYSLQKSAYLSSVNNFIKQESGHPKSLVDVGSGDGRRSREIANLLKVKNVSLIDNSAGMIALSKRILGTKIIKSDISSHNFTLGNRFDVVLCLWNVLGHICEGKRKHALMNVASLIKDDGVLYLDVNNRYNISQYGIKSATTNLVKDCIYKKSTNGDFVLSINTPSREIQTIVHIFSPQEIENLIVSAGLTIDTRKVINYESGTTEKYIWRGQLVYKLKR